MNVFFACAAGLAAFNTSLHFFAGGKTIARPLLNATELAEDVRYIQYFCWHIASLTLAFQALLFAVAAVLPGQANLAIVGTAMATSVGLLGLAIPIACKLSYREVPQGWLFVPVTILGVIGLLT
ncbi:MAG: hypothetical protein ACX94D_11785 [Henriciella sp.]